MQCDRGCEDRPVSEYESLPIRGPVAAGLPVPPVRMPVRRDGRLLKRWRYVGLWGERHMLCAARVQVGPARQRFWALWDGERLRGRTSMLPIGVAVDGVAQAGPFDLRWQQDGDVLEVCSRHGDSYIWTRKAPLRASGTIDGEPVELRGLLDDSAGYHARDTSWRWCAGVGEAADGSPVSWNLTNGMHDAATAGSERALWVGGVLSEPPAGEIAPGLDRVDGPAGERLDAEIVATRSHRQNLGLLATYYSQPFARFSGTLPGGAQVARGWGVLERHTVRWP